MSAYRSREDFLERELEAQRGQIKALQAELQFRGAVRGGSRRAYALVAALCAVAAVLGAGAFAQIQSENQRIRGEVDRLSTSLLVLEREDRLHPERQAPTELEAREQLKTCLEDLWSLRRTRSLCDDDRRSAPPDGF